MPIDSVVSATACDRLKPASTKQRHGDHAQGEADRALRQAAEKHDEARPNQRHRPTLLVI